MILTLVLAVLANPTLAGEACEFPAVYFFGASNLDTGNFLNDPYWSTQPFAPTAAQGYWKGRWQSGPVWADAFADRLGLSAKASSEGGTNYAFGAASTSPHPGDPTVAEPGTPGYALYLSTQITQALSDANGTLNPAAIYVLEIGHNDVALANRTVDEAPTAGGVVITQMQRLRDAGASIFLVRLLGAGQEPYATPFNQAVLSGVEMLRTGGATMYVVSHVDFASHYLSAAHLNAIGITQFAVADNCRADANCQQAATAAAQSDEIYDHSRLFFDNIGPHWNHRVHADMARHALAQIPACEIVYEDGFESP
jgi:hypothetical protein